MARSRGLVCSLWERAMPAMVKWARLLAVPINAGASGNAFPRWSVGMIRPSSMPGRIPLESLAGIAWNPWPESNGITGRDHVESVAGIVWNLHDCGAALEIIKKSAVWIVRAVGAGRARDGKMGTVVGGR